MNQENLLSLDTPSNNNNIQYFNNEYNSNDNTLSITQSVSSMIIKQIIFFFVLITGFMCLL